MSTSTKKPTSKKTFSYTPQNDLPKLGKIKTEWDLGKIFYKKHTAAEIENDVLEAEKRYTQFAKKYAKKDFCAKKTSLLKSLKDYRNLHDTNIDRVFVYFFLLREQDATDTKAEQLLNQLQQRVTTFSNQILFYELAIGKLPKKEQARILKDKDFEPFHFLLRGIFDNAQYTLSEAEEKILSLKSLPARSLWIAGTEKILNTATIKVGGKEEPLNGAMMEVLDAPKKRRHALWKGIKETLSEIGPIAENELTALCLDKKISDELRGYQTPYAATVRSFDTTEQSLQSLVQAVTTRGYKASRKFYKLKAALFNTAKIDYIDRDDYPKRLPELALSDAVTICRDAFYGFNQKYGEIFDEMIQNGHLDMYPKSGKGGGAFCISSVNTPTMVMLNHADDFSSLRTMAHEMGHAVHAYRSKTQDVLYEDHSVITAETASTLFEAIVADSLMQQMSDAQKVIYLNALISDKISTMMMCIARYKAELEIHETVRAQGSMTWTDMSAVLAKHFREYCGPAIHVDDTDGLSVVAKTHYRRNFYQFSYSFGVIASSIMFARYKADPSYATDIDTFLQAGEKDTVEHIYGEIGIDTSKPEVFNEGIALLEKEIATFAKLVSTKSK